MSPCPISPDKEFNVQQQRNFQMLETNGIRLRTVVEGNGPLVILLWLSAVLVSVATPDRSLG